MEHKIPPQALDIERAVLGAIMLRENTLLEIIDIIEPDCFYDHNHRKIYERAILPLFIENTHIDLLTVTQKLRKANCLNKTLSDHYIADITIGVSNTHNAQTHALILKQFTIKRKLIQFCSQTVQQAYRDDSDALDLLDTTAQNIDQIAAHLIKKPFTKLDEIVHQNIQRIDRINTDQEELIGIPSGFYELDKITSGWQRSDLIILAARPGMGKTTFALNMAQFAAVHQKIKVALFSLEMSKNQIGNKAISAQTHIDLNKLVTGKIEQQEWDKLHQNINPLLKANIFIDDTGALTIYEIKAKLRRLRHEHPDLGLVIIDYLQLINGKDPENKNQNREQQISYISRSLKAIAKELNLPLIALSQLSRSVETRGGDKKPMLSDLRESGAIEADADIVTFLYRPEYYQIYQDAEGNDIRGQALLIIAKHRNGKQGEVKLGFLPEQGRFLGI